MGRHDPVARADLANELADQMAARGSEHGIGAADRVEPTEDCALQRHVLGYRLDNEIGADRCLEPRRRRDPRERRRALRCADQPMGHEHRQARSNFRERGLETRGVAPDQGHAPASPCEHLGDAVRR